ncbi:MAG: RNA polymerase factor sigma-54, partial [Planctomycetaceae bacterium]|nr:RNA polymerase factor sigma-54 [Planctomycetaceae bacterium]
TLHEYLLEQFHCDAPAHLRAFGDYLIHNLDENGRLQSSLPELAAVFGGVTLEEAEAALSLVQNLDPPGVGARDLRECLLLQITPETPLREHLITLISDHLDDIIQNRLPLIERKTGYSMEDVKATIEQMRTLNPFPGRGFDTPPVQSITPDLKVEKDDNGEYTVSLIDEYVPELRLNRRYIRMLEQNPDAATKEYIKKKLESAKWLIDAIEQRYNTLKRVAQCIVDEQTDFLDYGPEHIKPLKMQDVADVVGVHVTTVSRAVDDKHIATPRGIFPLKRFFGGGTKTADGEDVAWENIRLKLKEVVDNEDKSKPLSDDAIVEALQEHGLNLARRTVTKYRKAMNIPSSRQRREF